MNATITRLAARRAISGSIVLMLTLLASIGVSRLQYDRNFKAELPKDYPYVAEEREFARTFSATPTLVITVDGRNNTPFDAETISAVTELNHKLARIPGVNAVSSIANATYLVSDHSTITTRSVLQSPHPTAAEISSAERTIRADPLLSQRLITPDGKALVMILSLKNGGDNYRLVQNVERTVASVVGKLGHVGGTDALDLALSHLQDREFVPLLVFLMVVVWLVLSLVLWSWSAATIVWITSVLPAFWALALLPLFGLHLNMLSLLAPLLVLVLATSYGIHTVRYQSIEAVKDYRVLAKDIRPVVYSAGITTIAGVGALCFSPIVAIEKIAAVVAIGIVLSMLFATEVFPALLLNLRIHRIVLRRRYFASPHLLNSALPFVVAAIVAAGLCAIPFGQRGIGTADIVKSRTALFKELSYFAHRFGGLDQISLVLDTGSQYGLVHVDTLRRVEAIRREIAQMPGIAAASDVGTILEWANGALFGDGKPQQFSNNAEIGETLELLFSGDTANTMATMVDAQYRRTVITIRLAGSPGPNTAKREQRVIRKLLSMRSRWAKELGGTAPLLVGNAVGAYYWGNAVLEGQKTSLMLFYPLLGICAFIVTRRLSHALHILIPSLAAIGLYFFLIAVFNVPVSGSLMIGLSTVVGVSVDDVVFLVLQFQRRKPAGQIEERTMDAVSFTQVPIVQTTVVIAVGTLFLYVSSFRVISLVGVLTGLSLTFATLVTLVLIPKLFMLMKR